MKHKWRNQERRDGEKSTNNQRKSVAIRKVDSVGMK
jgi:hypothetical protein